MAQVVGVKVVFPTCLAPVSIITGNCFVAFRKKFSRVLVTYIANLSSIMHSNCIIDDNYVERK